MKKDDCFRLGHVAKTHGFKGILSIKIDSDDPEYYSTIKSLLIENNSSLTPFFIEEFQYNNNGFAKIKLEDIDSSDSARPLLGKSIYLPLELLPKLDADQFYFHEIIGYQVIDNKEGSLGTITNVIDDTPQPILEINTGNTEVLIPIVDEFIERVDKTQGIIFTKCPEGLISLYKE